MAAKLMSIGDILAAFNERTPTKSRVDDSTLEREIRRRLRKVGGKSADFMEYLELAVSQNCKKSVQFSKRTTLAEALAIASTELGEKAEPIVVAALEKYIKENDTSYHFKSA